MMVLPLLPFYATRLAATPETRPADRIVFRRAVAVGPVVGAVSDRYGRRPTLLIGLTA